MKLRGFFGLLFAATATCLALVVWTLFNGVRSDEDSYAGLPRSSSMELRPWSARWFHVIDPPGFLLGYSEFLRNPLWVAYRLEQAQSGKLPPRPRHFTAEPWSVVRVRGDAYRRSGFDRGHMAPNYAMARFEGRAAQLASFRMSNIVPQRPKLNQKLWQRLEELETDVYAVNGGNLWVLMGPLFSAPVQRMASGVAIPDAFFRIWLRENAAGEPQALAFIVPQELSGYEPLDRFITSIDEIEAATGLDFFHRLPDEQERRLEQSVTPDLWDLSAYARRTPRY